MSIAHFLMCYAGLMRIRRLNHSVYQLQYHIIWGTKYRIKWLTPLVKKEFLHSLYQNVQKYPTLHVFTANTDRDHIHLQLEAPPSITIASVVQKLKASTSFYLRKRFKFIREIYLEKEGIWSVGYFVSSIGLNETQIKQYITWQGKNEVPQTMKTIKASKQQSFEFS